jgi:hypothetical protein
MNKSVWISGLLKYNLKDRLFRMNSAGYKEDKPNRRCGGAPTYALLLVSLILFSIGLWLTTTHQTTSGVLQAGKYGPRKPTNITLNGTAVIFFGVLFSLFPLWQLFRYLAWKFKK